MNTIFIFTFVYASGCNLQAYILELHQQNIEELV
jgi:hypothetical protein